MHQPASNIKPEKMSFIASLDKRGPRPTPLLFLHSFFEFQITAQTLKKSF